MYLECMFDYKYTTYFEIQAKDGPEKSTGRNRVTDVYPAWTHTALFH